MQSVVSLCANALTHLIRPVWGSHFCKTQHIICDWGQRAKYFPQSNFDAIRWLQHGLFSLTVSPISFFNIIQGSSKMNKSLVLAAIVASIALAACGKKEEAPVVVPAPAPMAAPAVAVPAAVEAASAASNAASAAAGAAMNAASAAAAASSAATSTNAAVGAAADAAKAAGDAATKAGEAAKDAVKK